MPKMPEIPETPTPPTPKNRYGVKRRRTPSPYIDRFIPVRTVSEDKEITHQSPALKKNTSMPKTVNPHHELIENTLRSSGPMLLFSPQKPKPQDSRISLFRPKPRLSTPKVLYRQPKIRISQILDAPEVLDDFYSCTIAFSPSNHFITALQTNDLGTLYHVPYDTSYALKNVAISSGLPGTINTVLALNDTDIISGWGSGVIRRYKRETETTETLTHMGARTGACLYDLETAHTVCSLTKIDENTIMCGIRGGWLTQLDLRTPRGIAQQVKAHTSHVTGIAYNQAQHIATGSNSNAVKLWDIAALAQGPIATHTGHKAAVKALNFQSRIMLTSGGGLADPSLITWETNRNCLNHLCNTQAQVSGLQFLQDKRYMVTSHGFATTSQKQLKLWKLTGSHCALLCETEVGAGTKVISLAKANNDTFAAVASDQSLKFFTVETPSKSAEASFSAVDNLPCARPLLSDMMTIR